MKKELPTVGQTVVTENGQFRVKRYRSSLCVTELVNAGKRGKTCQEVSLHDYDVATESDSGALVAFDAVLQVLFQAESASQVECLFRAFCAFVEGKCLYTAKTGVRTLKGVDVSPAGVEKLTIHTSQVFIQADGSSFTVRDLCDRNNEPTLIPPTKASKTAVKAFYAFVKENSAILATYTFNEVYHELNKLGIGCHYYCAVD